MQQGKAGSGGYLTWAVCPLDREGRLVAVTARAGVAVVDVVRGEEVALLPLRNKPFHAEPSGALLTNGPAGLMRWPVSVDPQTGKRRYGPSEKLSQTVVNSEGNDSSADARVLAIANGKGALVLFPAENRVVQVGPQEDVRHAAISPDGRWVATGSHDAPRGPGAKFGTPRAANWSAPARHRFLPRSF